jgi:amino acid adenylation domain-containing protein/thioester reductase-like protein
MNTTEKNFDEIILPDLFAEQVSKTPDAIALIDYNDDNNKDVVELTYRQVDEITDQLAVKLVEEYNVRPDSVVGILLPRCAQYVLAYVAILKAGGAYMPLELVYPKPLLERAVHETDTKVVLTNSTYSNRIDDQSLVMELTDEYPFFDVGDEKKNNEETKLMSYPSPNYIRPNADHLAFCVMSSGTTGTPKGICQTHRAAVHSYLDRATRFPYHSTEGGDRIGAGVFFVWELMRPLCFGGTCIIIPDHVLFDPDAVTKFIQNHNITRILWTPSLLQLVLDAVPADKVSNRLSGLRYMWLCGEVVSRDLAVGFTTLLPNVELMNLYSISECHDVSIGDLKLLSDNNGNNSSEDDAVRKYATCGKAIPGVKFYIVDLEDDDDDEDKEKSDGTMKLVPAGETGEVYVGGPVVGRGYLNMPEKTAERFVDNPFSQIDDDGAVVYAPRLYRTGDLGRVLPVSKELEILGRCDFMVKIRGYSVVLGAIETALAKHPKLSSSVVLAVGEEGSRDGKKLVAYVVPVSWNDPPSASSVRQFLKDHVPTYAIPSTFCVIDALPVAASAAGKLDRKKLPSHETAQRLRAFSIANDDDDTTTTKKRLSPENDTERGILEIWSQLLDLPSEDLSALDSFFEVGGHSLLATKMVQMINNKFGKTSETGLSIITVMEAPTIRDMARALLNGGQSTTAKIDMQAEAMSLDPSIYPFPTRKGNTMSRFRIESSALLKPRVVFLTGGTGYLGSHILSQLLQIPGLTTICLARAKTDTAAKQRLLQTMDKYQLLKPTIEAIKLSSTDEEKLSSSGNINASDEKTDEAAENMNDDHVLDSRLIAIAGDLSKPLLGIDDMQFKSLALEIDSIIHCGAEVNLIKPYSSLKESNVLGTQEVLRLATTNGYIKTKVKPVHYISTNGIFPVDSKAYHGNDTPEPVHLKEDVDLDKFTPFLSEGYAMTKWVAERMVTVAESRGLPVSILRPGNMAGSSLTGISNPDDLNYLLIQGILDAGCAPLLDTTYALDLTPVDFAAKAVTQLAALSPHLVIGQRMHLQSPHKQVTLKNVVDWLNDQLGHSIKPVTRDEWMERISTTNEKLSSGWLSFEKYFEAYSWLEMDSNNLQQALKDTPVKCPDFDVELLKKWFPNKV